MQMQVFVGKLAPDFTAKAVMPDNLIEHEFNLKNYLKGHKGVLFFYPLDFTFVCPTEIIAFNNRIGDFAARNTRIIAVSVDSHYSHLAWKNTPFSKGGIDNIQIPLVSDLNKEISRLYNVLNDDGISLRGTFLIDEKFQTRHILVNDLALGRNVDETLRTIDALIENDEYGNVCPAGWQNGAEAIKPSSEGVSHYLSSYAEKL